ncbi:MAG: hypothetical protein KDJ52_19235 [Anaerolineae bacterium]|nr:hypothetical protein [Anaerolineae bacterium]
MSIPHLNITHAFDFYKRFILDYSQDKSVVYQKYGFTLQGSIGFKDWEVFVAILLNDKAKSGDGADLEKHEVKSANLGSSYEYQYHKNHGLQKLNGDKHIDHVFIGRSEDYSNIEVWWVSGSSLAPKFDSWEPDLKKNYKEGIKQRFRRSITHSFVAKNGHLLVEIKNGKLIVPED